MNEYIYGLAMNINLSIDIAVSVLTEDYESKAAS